MAHPTKVIVTISNVADWPKVKALLDQRKVIADKTGRLRYPHGAPVGAMILVSANGDKLPRYKEAAEEWFDPDSQKAREFVWPK
jgi:hypothetical protein